MLYLFHFRYEVSPLNQPFRCIAAGDDQLRVLRQTVDERLYALPLCQTEEQGNIQLIEYDQTELLPSYSLLCLL